MLMAQEHNPNVREREKQFSRLCSTATKDLFVSKGDRIKMLQNLHYCYCIMREDSILQPRSGEPELLVSSLLFSSLLQAASNPNPSLLLQTLFFLQDQFTKKDLFSTTRDDAQGQVPRS